MLQLGSTFISTSDDGEGIPAHLWIVISDPEKDPHNVVIANLTTSYNRKTATCILCKGEHPFIQRDSEVNYRKAKCVSCAKITHSHRNGKIQIRDPVNRDVMDKILDGASRSHFLDLKFKDILIQQRLI